VILYLSGSTTPTRLEHIANKAGANHFLFTFAHQDAQDCAKHFCLQPDRRTFIDSGAYSVWSNGGNVDLAAYIAFCKEIMGMAECPVVFAALDVIAGKKADDELPTEGEIEKACAEGWNNYQTMKQQGIPCLATYHQFDDLRWLKRIADDSDYFAVGPRKRGVSAIHRFKWLQEVFRYFGSSKKIHGFGVSTVDWMKEFPFFSVDSTAWLQSARAHLHFRSRGGRPLGWTLEQWKKLARKYGMPTRYLKKSLGYGTRGKKPDPNGPGSYWLMFVAMWVWQEKGVDFGQCVARPWWYFEPEPWWKSIDPDL